MTEYDNTNRGAIWKNEKKQTDKDPDFTGDLDVEGKKYFFDAWKRDPSNTNPKAPALKFRVKAKNVQPSISQRAEATIRKPDPISSGRPSRDDLDDLIPF